MADQRLCHLMQDDAAREAITRRATLPTSHGLREGCSEL